MKKTKRTRGARAALSRTEPTRARSMRIPSTMRAAAIDRFGSASVVTLHELPVPRVGANEVLVAVHTAGVGSWDAEMRGGWWPDEGKPRFPVVLGVDGSGTVVAVGSRVRRLAVGDKVYAYSFASRKGGFHAEYVAVPSNQVAALPSTLDLVSGGAIAAVALTALQGIDDALHVRRGEYVVVHGASGGVGSLAVQFAKLRGAHVLAVASGRDGVALVRRLGADAAVDGKRGDVAAAVRAFAPDGVDAVLALVTGESLRACTDALRRGGRLAYPNGVEPAPRKRKGISVTSYDANGGVREFARLTRAIEASQLVVPIDDRYSLGDAARAHERIEKGHVLGKVVLRIR